jgi:hypothetical protein
VYGEGGSRGNERFLGRRRISGAAMTGAAMTGATSHHL